MPPKKSPVAPSPKKSAVTLPPQIVMRARVFQLREDLDRRLDLLMADEEQLGPALTALCAALQALDGTEADAKASDVWRTWEAAVGLIRGGTPPEVSSVMAVLHVAGRSGVRELEKKMFPDRVMRLLERSAQAYVKGPRVGQASEWRGLFDSFAEGVGVSQEAIKRKKPRKMPL